jgi:hypothetical protein
MTKPLTKCWICGEDATTGEHKTKRSDLRSVFGEPTQSQPLYYHDMRRTNQLVRSLDAKILKSPSRICADCNNARTQPHDFAWAYMSTWLRFRNPAIRAGDLIRGNRIFPYFTSAQMLKVHLFFLKQFGGLIEEAQGNITIDIKPFATAIMAGRAHPNVYLQLAIGPYVEGKPVTGRSEFHGLNLDSGRCALGMWFYQVDGLTVNVIFADPDQNFKYMNHVWHPRRGSNRLLLHDYNDGLVEKFESPPQGGTA